MPFIPPHHCDLIYKVEALVKAYQGQNRSRQKLVALLAAFAKLFPSTNHIVAVLIFAAEKINHEYTYITPKTTSYPFGYETGSSLFTAIEKVLGIEKRNQLSDDTRIIYLSNLLNFLPSESQLNLDDTEYSTIRTLCKDLAEVIAHVVRRSHPELLSDVEAKPTATTISSYLNYIPQSISSLLVNPFSSATTSEHINHECRDALLSLPHTLIPVEKKVGVLQAFPYEIKLEQKHSPTNS